MKRFLGILAIWIATGSLVAASSAVAGEEDDAIKATIVDCYIEGIHTNQDVDAIRRGFHEDFAMISLNKDGEISRMTIQEWIARIEEGKKKNPDRVLPKVDYEFVTVEVSGNAAVVRIELYKDGKHAYTDFMSLYKFDDGWKILAKTYYRHP